jgi:hypothetical protein
VEAGGGHIMVAEVFAGLGALKSAFDMAKGLKDIDNAARRNAAVIELQEKILTAQSVQSDLVERMRELELQVAGFETWKAEKKRYKLTDFGGGTFAYLLKAEAADGEPSHRLCAQCYQKNQKSILQFLHRSHGQDYYKCQNCGEQMFGVYSAPPVDFYGDPENGDFMTR